MSCAVLQMKTKKAGPRSVFNSVIQKLEQQYMVSPFINIFVIAVEFPSGLLQSFGGCVTHT